MTPKGLRHEYPAGRCGRGTGRHYSDGNGYRRDHTRIVSGYQDVSPGSKSVTVSASGGGAKSSVTLAAGTVHTLVVLDGASGLEVVNLEDASGSGKPR